MPNCSPDCPVKATGTCYVKHGCRCEVCRAYTNARVQNHRRARNPRDLPAEQHGTVYGYVNWNCRCEPCKAAKSVQRKSKDPREMPPGWHGTDNGYSNWRCRCPACRKAHSDTRRRSENRQIVRRIQGIK